MKKKTVYIDLIEVWPIHILVGRSNIVNIVEVDAAKLTKWKASIAAFKQTQKEMAKAILPSKLDPHTPRKAGKL